MGIYLSFEEIVLSPNKLILLVSKTRNTMQIETPGEHEQVHALETL